MIRGDYIPGSDRRYFYNISIRELRVSTEHRMILAELRGCGEPRNLKYHRERASWTIATPKRGPIRKEDATFNDLQKKVKKPTGKAQFRETCILEATWRLADQRTTLRWNHPVDQ